MGIDLIYKHQRVAYDLMKKGLEENGKAAYVFPTGAGKSFLSLKYMEEFPDKKFLLVSPSIEIINQFKRYIREYFLDGKPVTKDSFPNFRAITYQKVNFAEDFTKLNPDVIVFDEIHRMGAENWEQSIDKLIETNPNAQIIGMSATPERTDKRNMAYEKFGDNIIYEMSLIEALSGSKENEVVLNGAKYVRVISELKQELPKYKMKIESLDDEGKKEKLIEKYEELNAIVSKSPQISDIMQSSLKKKNGKYIVFCADRASMFEQLERVDEIFGKVNPNISVDYVISRNEENGKKQKENRLTLENFQAKEKGDSLNLLFCVDMLNEGVHISGIDGEIQFKPTKSKIRYKQMIGRVLSSDRSADETVIVDAVNNWIRQIDVFSEIENAIQKGDSISKDNGGHARENVELVKLNDQEEELIDILKEIQEDLMYSSSENTFDEIVKWLETHDGNMPRGNISKKQKHIKDKDLTEEERKERRLYSRWYKSKERKILNKYVGVPLKDFPKELEDYVDKIDLLRSYGYGLEKPSVYEEIINWLETHDGNMPKSSITRHNKKVSKEKLSEDEKYQVGLYDRWRRSEERKVLEACKRNRYR